MATRDSKEVGAGDRLCVRVDNRLLHGQVVQFWLGHLKIEHLVVADDDVAQNDAMMTIYRLAMPKAIGLTITRISALAAELESSKSKKTMVLLKDIKDLELALSLGADFKRVTLGNIHASPARSRITESVHLADDEVKKLIEFRNMGVEIEIRTFPGDGLLLDVDEKGGGRWLKS